MEFLSEHSNRNYMIGKAEKRVEKWIEYWVREGFVLSCEH